MILPTEIERLLPAAMTISADRILFQLKEGRNLPRITRPQLYIPYIQYYATI